MPASDRCWSQGFSPLEISVSMRSVGNVRQFFWLPFKWMAWTRNLMVFESFGGASQGTILKGFASWLASFDHFVAARGWRLAF